jgi:hypothetical protein
VRESSGNKLTRIHSHDEEHIGKLADLGRYRSGRRVRGNCHPRLHVSLVDRVNKGDGIRCVMVSVRDLGLLRDGGQTCSLDMKAVEGSPRICNVIDPLTRADVTCYRFYGDSEAYTHLLWFRNHHMAVHENPRHTLRNARKDRGT